MTREEKIDIFAMRIDGCTFQEIADKYGVSRQAIQQMLRAISTESGVTRKNYIYPNIADWLIRNNISQRDFAKNIGFKQTAVSSYLTGKNPPHFTFINAVIKETGMPFEVAFHQSELEDKHDRD